MGRVLLDAVIQMGNSDVSHGIGDLIQAVVLLHTAGEPLRPFDTFESAGGASGRGFAARQTEALGQERKENWPVPNPEQWQPLRRWASYLGLARMVGREGLIPDASEALLRRLPAMAPGTLTCATRVARCAPRYLSWTAGRYQAGHGLPLSRSHAVLSGGLSISLLCSRRTVPDHGPASDAGNRNFRCGPTIAP
jgi:hypothetical protein